MSHGSSYVLSQSVALNSWKSPQYKQMPPFFPLNCWSCASCSYLLRYPWGGAEDADNSSELAELGSSDKALSDVNADGLGSGFGGRAELGGRTSTGKAFSVWAPVCACQQPVYEVSEQEQQLETFGPSFNHLCAQTTVGRHGTSPSVCLRVVDNLSSGARIRVPVQVSSPHISYFTYLKM